MGQREKQHRGKPICDATALHHLRGCSTFARLRGQTYAAARPRPGTVFVFDSSIGIGSPCIVPNHLATRQELLPALHILRNAFPCRLSSRVAWAGAGGGFWRRGPGDPHKRRTWTAATKRPKGNINAADGSQPCTSRL